jgi:hypothetical protein
VGRGNVLLVTEEDYFNDGDELLCDRAGTFQTWKVPTNKSCMPNGNKVTLMDRWRT